MLGVVDELFLEENLFLIVISTVVGIEAEIMVTEITSKSNIASVCDD